MNKTHSVAKSDKQYTDVLKAYGLAAMADLSSTCSGMALGQVSVQIKPVADRKVVAEKHFIVLEN